MVIGGSCVYRKTERPKDPEVGCITMKEDTISFKAHLIPLLQTNCATPGCHSGSNPEGNLNLEPDKAYAELTNRRKGYLDTINPDYSLLYNSLTSPANIMPPTGKMDDCKIETIMKWVRQKAKNN